MNSTKTCEFCDKRGLPLLLVRHAVAPVDSGAPLASGLPIDIAPSVAHYTKRVLRSGYVNVFDESRRRWETYFVTPDGFLFKIFQTAGATPVVPQKSFNCPDEGHRAIASCITIPDPKNASKVWIGFSDVLWTDAVRKRNEDAAYRSRHMIEVDVKAALKRSQKPHHPIAQLGTLVAEYAMSPVQGKSSFDGSPFAFISRHAHAARLRSECDSMRQGSALIITLPDPAGLAQELAFLMKHNADSFVNKNPEDKRKIAASMAIDQIKTAVFLQAEEMEMEGAEQIADQRLANDPFGHWMLESTRETTERIRSVNYAQLKRASAEAWKKYDEKFNDKKRDAWLKFYGSELSKFDENYISPLALAHVAWMKSSSLSDYFECNYDQRNKDSGKTYTVALSHCILATQDKKVCSDLYQEWLDGDISDPKNLLLRALVLNQSTSIDAIKNAMSANVSFRQIPWDNLFATHDAAVGRFDNDAQDIAAKFLVQISGPIARAFNKVMDGSAAFRAAVMATGIVSGHPVVVCEVTGSKKKFLEYLVRQLLQSNANQISEPQMKRAVKAELKRLQIHGVRLEGEAKKKWIVVADKDLIKSMPANLTPQEQANWIAKSMGTVEALENTNLVRWRSVVNANAPKVVMAIVQLICFTKVWEDEKKSLSNEKKDAVGRLHAGIAAMLSTSAEIIGGVMKSRAGLGLRFGQGIAKAGGVFHLGGKVGGICAGLYLAVLDGFKAYGALSENQVGLAWLYGASSAIGIGLALALSFPAILGVAAIPVIGFLFVLAIVVGLLIDRIKDNPIQDWLERCPWGLLESQHYADMETEQSQLIQALK
ncbi:hypothetical protein IM543_06310 [Massilia sp. UMI-21]|nr:hypothetical protein IM543_06310 [Massilia sp. UMI-21]